MAKKIIKLTKEDLSKIVKDIAKKVVEKGESKCYAKTLQDEELTEGVTYLHQRVTGLPCDIIVDCGKTYEYYNHPLCLYVVKGNNVYPVDIARSATSPFEIPSEVLMFIEENYDSLCAFANMEIDGPDFFDIIESYKNRHTHVNVLGCGTVNNNHVLREENVLRNDDLMEYAKLGKQYTGLNVDIFVDDGEAYKRNKHPLWIYVRNGYSNTDSFFPVVVSKTPFVPSHISKDDINIQEDDLEAVMVFVSINALLLRDFADEKVEHMDFYKICKPVIYDIKKASRGISLDESAALALNYGEYDSPQQTYGEIDEMARINMKETGNCFFPFDSWELKIWSNDHEPAHFHIIKDGWDVSFDIENGSLIEIKAQGQKQSILDYMSQNVCSWLDSKCFIQPKLTNRENARITWEQLH
jgi:hypothetical protein